MIVTLDDLKAHLRVSSDDENELIIGVGLAAQLQIENWIGRPIYASESDLPAESDPTYSPVQIVADATIIVAIKMLAYRIHEERGGEGGVTEEAVLPSSVRSLLSGVRVFNGGRS